MKRSIKNIIMLVLIILLGVGMFFTINNLKSTTSNSMVGAPNENSSNNQMAPSDNSNSNSQNSDNAQTPPNNSENNSSENGQSNNSQTPPDKPEDNNSQDNSNNQNNSNNQTPPDKPEDNSNSGSNSNDNQGNGNSNNQMTPPDNSNNQMVVSSNDNSLVYYVLIISESIVLSALVMYLIMSRFNKKTFKETFKNKDKTVITILSVIILTGGLYILSDKIDLNKSNTSNTQNNSQSSNITYSSAKEITEDTTLESGTFESSTKDENAILVNGDIKATLSNITVNKTGDSDSGDNSNFYGTNSGILAKSKANLTLKNITVTTKANGANGVFSYGGSATTNNTSADGTTVNISDSKITTTGDNAGGIMTTGGGVMNATNLTINTKGTSSAAIRTDRGGGTVTVNKGTYTTTGAGSPAIYSTADITVKNAKLISKASEGVVIEGKNNVTLENVTLTDTNNKLNGKSTTYKNIFIYQSMSGDADTGTASFTSKASTITTNKGDTLYVTNTKANITLENNKITNKDTTGNFLRIQKDSWGTSGSNGGDVTLTMTNQTAKGNIVVDSISLLDISLKTNSSYEGTINKDNSAKSIKLTLDKSSKIKLTGDSYVTSLDDTDTTYSNIDFNGYKLYVNGKAIN